MNDVTGPRTQYMTKCSECGRQAWTQYPNKPGVLCYYCERELRKSMRVVIAAEGDNQKDSE